MGVLADEYIRLRADTSHMSRDVRKAGTTAGRTFGGTFAGAAKRLLAGGALFTGVALVARFLGDATEAARESNKVGKTTAQIIKSTGGAAKVSSDQVSALATAISLKTGQDDEAIQSGANLLLTFKNVRNEVGAGAKIFDRATLAAVDLSAAGFGSVDSASKMLGKALNDPLKGLTALGRAGVTFTDQQKKQIKAMIESGDVLGAQKLIMKEVESQVGGVAAAQATWAEKAKTAFGNVKEVVGDFLLKGLEPISKWFVEKGFPAIQDFFDKISKNKDLQDALKRLGEAIQGIADKDFAGTLDMVAQKLPAIVNGMADAANAVGEFYDAIVAVNGIIGKEARGGMFDEKGPLGFITTFLKDAWRDLAASFVETFGAIIAGFGRFKDRVIEVISALVSGIKTTAWKMTFPIRVAMTAIGTIMVLGWMAIRKPVLAAINFIKDRVIFPAWAAIVGRFKSAMATIRAAWSAFWGVIRSVVSTAWNFVFRNIISPVWNRIRSIWTSHQTAVRGTWSSFWTNVKSTASAAINAVRTTISSVLTRITNAFSTAKANIKRVWDGLKGVVSAPVQWIKNNVYNKPLVPVWNRVASLVSGPKLSTYATGGVIPGYEPGRDSVPIMAGKGEAIMRPEWTRAVGKDWIDKANKAARSGKRSLHDFLGESVPASQGGGIGWLKGLASGVTSKVGSMKDWLLGGLRAAAGKLLDPVKGLINRAMPNSGVGTTVGNIGKKAIDLVLDKIKKVDVIPDLGGGPAGSAIASGGWASIYRILRAVGARSFTTYPGHDQGASRSRDIWPASAGDRVAETARRISSIWYVIWKRRIASITTGRRWIGYHGSNPHTSHVHVTLRPGVKAAMGGIVGNGLASGGIVKGGHGGLNTWIGEGRRDELVTPLPKGWRPGDQDAKLDRLIAAIERNGLGGTTVNLGGVHNPLPEKPSITVNKVMQRVAGLGLV